MNQTFKSMLGQLQRYLGNSSLLCGLTVKLRNQCDAVIHAHLNDGIDMNRNGEMWLINTIAPDAKTFIDVGANTGAWTKAFLEKMQRPLKGILIEPSPHAFRMLTKMFESEISSHALIALQQAAADSCGSLPFYTEENAGETSSLVSKHSHPSAREISVMTTTIDEVINSQGLAFVDMLKIDAEGYDLNVLLGAENSLRTKSIGVIQFEYNRPWAYTGSTLAYAIDYLNKFEYNLFLLKNKGLYSFTYENFGDYFGYSNFVAFAPGFPHTASVNSL